MSNDRTRLDQMTPGVIELDSQIAVDDTDRKAGLLINYLSNALLPDSSTFGEALEILEAAHWWLTLWAAQAKADKMLGGKG